MGRGLAAILSVSDGPRDADELRELPVDLIAPNPHQPRRAFDEAALQALADSIAASGRAAARPRAPGRGRDVRARRRRAPLARRAARRARARPRARPRRATTPTALEVALIENMAREDLNPVEEARACAALVEELGLTREEVGLRVGRSRVAVSNLLRLLDLPDEALALLEAGELTEGHGRALLLADDHAARRRLARGAAREGWSVRDARGARPRGQRRDRRRRRARPPAARRSTPTRRRRSRRSPRRSAAPRPRGHASAPRATGYRVELELSRRMEEAARPRAAALRPGDRRYTAAPARRAISSVG